MPPFASRRLVLLAAVLGAGCGIPAATSLPAGLRSPYTGYASARFRDDRMWLCRPDLPRSACREDLSATELRADGSRAVIPHVAADHPDADCFYVYPTVDLGILPGNHTDLDDLGRIAETARSQAARFDEACALYVPLYRQVTIGTYLWGGRQKERRLDVAFSDVEDAFLHYLGTYNHGRRIVLIGHSQGAEMILRLLRRRFEQDPELRARLLVALPIGAPPETGGGAEAGPLPPIPTCARADEIGCIVAYHSFAATGRSLDDWIWDEATGRRTACVNPAAVGQAGWHVFSRSYFPTTGLLGRLAHVDGVTTPFVLVRDLYWGACVNDDGREYLLVAAAGAPGDVRRSPVDLGSSLLGTNFGLHVLDLQFPQGDLIDLIQRKAARGR
jgi:hypothetical protein